MDERKDVIKNLSGIVIATGLAVASQGSSGIIMGVLNGIAGNLASSFIEKANLKKMGRLLRDVNPSELNHDLQKLIVKSVEWSIRNIEILYREDDLDRDQQEALHAFTQDLLAEVNILNDSLTINGQKLVRTIEQPGDTSELLNMFDLTVSSFPTIQEERPFSQFFREQFQPNVQLCFGELLKDEKNRPAFIAYQRVVYSSLEESISKVIEQNDLLIKKLDQNSEIIQENQNWDRILKVLTNTPGKTRDRVFLASLNAEISQLSTRTELVVEQNEQILSELSQVKGITKGFSRQLQTGWVERNKIRVIGFLSFLVIVIVALTLFLRMQPFQLSLQVLPDPSIALDPEYPSLQADSELKVFLPNGIRTRELTSQFEIVLNDLSASERHAECRIELLDPYWMLSADHIQLSNGGLLLLARPNGSLATVEGNVLSRDGTERIGNAMIMVRGKVTYSDSLGYFSMELPMGLRKPVQEIRIEKDGFIPIQEQYLPGSPKEFRLIRQ